MLMNIAAMAMANPGILGASTPSAGVPNSTFANGTEGASGAAPAVDEQLSVLVGGVSSPILGWILRYLHIDPKLLIPILGTISFVTFAWQYIESHVLNQLDWFMCTVELRPEDEIYVVMSSWIAAQPFAQKSKSFVVNSSSFNSRRLWDPCWWWNDGKEDEEDMKEKRSLFFTPAPGNHYFWYQRRLLVFRRHCNREGAGYMSSTEREHMSISCFGRDPWVLKKLLHDAYTEYNGKEDDKTLIYRGVMKHTWGVATWQKSISKASRPFDTVILNESLKDEVVCDIQDYLKPATRRWYSNRGIPYRRGYLLYGPPGTGKSSLSLALAGYFKMRIYIVSLSSVVASEENLSTLFADLPRKCMVLLEDIDTAGLTHTRENDNGSDDENDGDIDDSRRGHSRRKRVQDGKLSLSGLLNILDGVASQEGRILIMTTNHVEKLDKALIRPGRVDLQIKFSLADQEISTSIFKSMYGGFENEQPNFNARKRPPIGQLGAFVSDSDSETEPEDVKQKREAEAKAKVEKERARVAKLADQFAKKVPDGKFSPAELQGFLLRHKCAPEKAIEGVEQWCADTLKEREEKEKKDAEENKKKEEKRLLRKEKRRLREEKKLQKLRERNALSDASDAESDRSDSDSCSDSEDGKPAKRRVKNARARRRAKNDTDSDSESGASSSEEEIKRKKKKKKSRARNKRRKPESESDSCGSSSEEETRRKRKSRAKTKSKKKAQMESSAADESKAEPKSEFSDLGAGEHEAKQPKVAVEDSGDSSDNTQDVKLDTPNSQDLEVTGTGPHDKGFLSPLKDTLKAELDSGYETPSEEGSVSGRHVSAPNSPSPLKQTEVQA